MYPLACVLPATVPRQRDRLMDVCFELFDVFVFLFCCAEGCFTRLWFILVSFWCPWECFGNRWPPRAPPKGPSRKSYETNGSLAAFGVPKGSLWGAILRYIRCFGGVCSSSFFKLLFGRLLGSLGTPSNHKNKGFVLTKSSFSHFHLELQNDQK